MKHRAGTAVGCPVLSLCTSAAAAAFGGCVCRLRQNRRRSSVEITYSICVEKASGGIENRCQPWYDLNRKAPVPLLSAFPREENGPFP